MNQPSEKRTYDNPFKSTPQNKNRKIDLDMNHDGESQLKSSAQSKRRLNFDNGDTIGLLQGFSNGQNDIL